jgi:hypothetical protein
VIKEAHQITDDHSPLVVVSRVNCVLIYARVIYVLIDLSPFIRAIRAGLDVGDARVAVFVQELNRCILVVE